MEGTWRVVPPPVTTFPLSVIDKLTLRDISTAMVSASLLIPFAFAALSSSVLDSFTWENRPILVFGEHGDPRIDEQMALFSDAALELEDRRNVIIVETDPTSDLWTRYRPNGFTVILIGLDGGEKFRNNAVTDPDELNELIDTMPMRQNEIQRRGRDPNMGGG
ncbi:MAG: DUF4174 domain-containing protein [Pseudomonadota bacterium]